MGRPLQREHQGSKVAQQESRREQPGSIEGATREQWGSNEGAKREHEGAKREQKYEMGHSAGAMQR